MSETTGPISIQLDKNVSLVILFQDCLNRHDLSKNMVAGGEWGGEGGAFFSSPEPKAQDEVL